MNISVHDNFLTENELKFTSNYFERAIWEFGHSSHEDEIDVYPSKWFVCGLDNNKFFSELLIKKISQISKTNWELLKVYANGQTILNDGNWHFDVDEEDEMNDSSDSYWTALLYVSDINHKNIEVVNGYTDFKINGEIKSIEPLQNRLVLFRSDILHRGRAPTIPGFLRISVAWKLKKIS
jgi:hypothetical protein